MKKILVASALIPLAIFFLFLSCTKEEIAPNSVTDYDGNVYDTVVIGNQIWMAENLRTTSYADGSAIPLVESVDIWKEMSMTDKAYCWYENNSSYGDAYGALYTWSAAMNGATSSHLNPSGVQGVCPDGWHIPSDEEWKQMEMYLGMSKMEADGTFWRGTNEGGMLKDTGTVHWASPNTGATNESGFSALPGGKRDTIYYHDIYYWANFWVATELDKDYGWSRGLYKDSARILRIPFWLKNHGLSVRCVWDSPLSL